MEYSPQSLKQPVDFRYQSVIIWIHSSMTSVCACVWKVSNRSSKHPQPTGPLSSCCQTTRFYSVWQCLYFKHKIRSEELIPPICTENVIPITVSVGDLNAFLNGAQLRMLKIRQMLGVQESLLLTPSPSQKKKKPEEIPAAFTVKENWTWTCELTRDSQDLSQSQRVIKDKIRGRYWVCSRLDTSSHARKEKALGSPTPYYWTVAYGWTQEKEESLCLFSWIHSGDSTRLQCTVPTQWPHRWTDLD